MYKEKYDVYQMELESIYMTKASEQAKIERIAKIREQQLKQLEAENGMQQRLLDRVRDKEVSLRAQMAVELTTFKKTMEAELEEWKKTRERCEEEDTTKKMEIVEARLVKLDQEARQKESLRDLWRNLMKTAMNTVQN